MTLGLKIDGIATSEHIDSSGELLIVENHDISDLVSGKGVMNWEHSNKSDDTIGAIIYAKKILKKTDCENDRQRKYWNTVSKPFVYIIGELYDDEEHPGALAVAAMIRYYAKKSENLLTGFSIEGATLERDDYILKESVGRRVAVTLRPCNKTAIAGLLEDPKTKDIAKSIEAMMARVDARLIEIDSVILEDMFMPKDPILDLHKAVESLAKTMEAGMYNVAPSQLTGQAALTREHISGFDRNRVKAAVRDWDRKRPLKEVLKATLPEVSDDYIGHFEKLAEELALKKNMPTTKLIRVGAHHAHPTSDDEQKNLIEGIYHDPSKKFKRTDDNPDGAKILRGTNDAGQKVLIKQASDPAAHHHYQIMKDVFGLGKYTAPIAMFSHPQIDGGRPKTAQLQIEKAGTALVDHGLAAKAEKAHKKDGHIHKLIIANHILGDTDRHIHNTIFHPDGYQMSIDHDYAFNGWNTKPDEIRDDSEGGPGSERLHPEAAKWVKSIDAKQLAGKMLDQGHDPGKIKTVVAGLKYYQKLADRKDLSISNMFDNAAGHMQHAANQQQYKKAV